MPLTSTTSCPLLMALAEQVYLTSLAAWTDTSLPSSARPAKVQQQPFKTENSTPSSTMAGQFSSQEKTTLKIYNNY